MKIFEFFADWHTKEICGFATPVAEKAKEFVDIKKLLAHLCLCSLIILPMEKAQTLL
jgi:hypothetical protein